MKQVSTPSSGNVGLPSKSNQGLIIALVIVIILAITGIIGTWYYMYNQQQKKVQEQQQEIDELHSTVSELQQQSKQKKEELEKFINYETKYEKLKFSYPSSFKLIDNSIPPNGADPAQDRVTILSPSGMELSIYAGAFAIGGSCEGCTFPLVDPITVLGKQRFLNFVQS